MTVRLSSKLPPLEGNGLAPLEDALAADPKERRVVIGIIDVGARFDMHADGILEPQVRFIQLEVIQGEDADNARDLMLSEYQHRTGATTLFEPDEDRADGDD